VTSIAPESCQRNSTVIVRRSPTTLLVAMLAARGGERTAIRRLHGGRFAMKIREAIAATEAAKRLPLSVFFRFGVLGELLPIRHPWRPAPRARLRCGWPLSSARGSGPSNPHPPAGSAVFGKQKAYMALPRQGILWQGYRVSAHIRCGGTDLTPASRPAARLRLAGGRGVVVATGITRCMGGVVC
jgi:hypothetical protein